VRRFSAFQVSCVVVSLLASGDASAFCRTTTSMPDSGYNPAVSGCWTQGTSLAWRVKRVPYAVASAASTQVSLSDATRVADLAFSAWNGTQCDGKPVGIEAYDEGSISVPDADEGDALAAWSSCTDSSNCDAAAHDVIVFDDAYWPYNDSVNTLALTTVTYGVDDGAIFEAYTEVNTAMNAITTVDPVPAGSNAYSLQAILTHEAGHFLGLAHATDTGAVMYAFYQRNAIALTADDVQGICTIYPPEQSSGCACATVGAGAGTTAAAGGLSLVALAALLRSRSRRRSRSAMHNRGSAIGSQAAAARVGVLPKSV
jgi:MYXO-CTERM domain-containing protein